MGWIRRIMDHIFTVKVKKVNADILEALKLIKLSCEEMHETEEACELCINCDAVSGVCLASSIGIKPKDWDLDLIESGQWCLKDIEEEEMDNEQ